MLKSIKHWREIKAEDMKITGSWTKRTKIGKMSINKLIYRFNASPAGLFIDTD